MSLPQPDDRRAELALGWHWAGTGQSRPGTGRSDWLMKCECCEYEYLQKAQNIKTGKTYSKRESAFGAAMDALFDVGKKGTTTPPSQSELRDAAIAAKSDLIRVRKRKCSSLRDYVEDSEEPESGASIHRDPDYKPDSDADSDNPLANPTASAPFRPRQISTAPQLMAFLDKSNCTSRGAFRTVNAVVATVKGREGVKLFKCGKSSFFRDRVKARKVAAAEIRRRFRSQKGGRRLTVHWDGIHVPLLAPGARRKTEERLPTIVTGLEVDQLLAARAIPSGSGQNTVREVLKCLEEWECSEEVVALCSDTPTSNTGYENGAASLIEKALGRDVLYVACRHHLLEIIPKTLFDRLVEKSTSPDLGALCRRLQDCWDSINKTAFKSAVEDPECDEFLKDRRASILEFAKEALQKPHTRADYRYLLELVVIFLGDNPKPSQPIKFSPPIAVSSARFMGRIIYCLTIHMFALTGEFALESDVLENLRQLNLIFVSTYLKPWFTSTTVAIAPRTDLQLANDIIGYTQSDQISAIAGSAFKNHLWYLHGVTVGLAFFDKGISVCEKREMVVRLSAPPPKKVSPWKRYVVPQRTNFETLLDKPLSHFVSETTLAFFKILKLDTAFLSEDPEKWPENEGYLKNLFVVEALQCINDVAERGVALVKRFVKNSLTRQEEGFQDLLLVQNDLLRQEKHSNASLTLDFFS
ncbi:Mitogen-activated protein kinase-binding protein 1 [Frankliniella fusca]|uniref:Mitogen-activated protein kinase-binding protein 1 n=1 Tax=Frankliniella fusca TaxID=407009 RepID=A0AAE1GWW7_9NEOP|nr:Mitogen-activated protein kinase-binding protein 1 [Frankliniella fusca]